MSNTALVAMSGGVDSAVAALLALRQGFAPAGVTLRLASETPGADEADAAAVAERLGIPFEVIDMTARFREQVITPFAAAYRRGETPNPCIDCNRACKFAGLLQEADRRGAAVVVTGHYARVTYSETAGRWLLQKGLDDAKDQSYVLYTLTQSQLARVRFPLGEYTKEQIRALARQAGLQNAEKRESQDICFVPGGDYAAFLAAYTGADCPPGDFVDPTGRVLGRHRGLWHYTVGQRRGLGLALPCPHYVCGLNAAKNTVTVAPAEGLLKNELTARQANWLESPPPPAGQTLRVTARVRYHQPEQPATLTALPGNRLRLVFDRPQRAITPGQAAVAYRGDVVVAGGVIEPPEAE